MSPLFERGFLQQETGLLSERWGQQGSNIINLEGGAISNTITAYTVTTGKTLFVNQLIIQSTLTTGDLVILKDSGTEKLTFDTDGLTPKVYNFTTPLSFKTSVVLTRITSGSLDYYFTIVGWEE